MKIKTPGPHPKTHSEILWHFTGGPLWDSKMNQQGKIPKSESAAYDILKNILRSKELRVGGYHELIKVFVAEERYFDVEAKQVRTRKNQVRELRTSPVCCVADIPISELYFHARRYGRFAIGFHRSSLIKSGFNPVFYAPQKGQIIFDFYQAQRSLGLMDESGIADAAESLKSNLEDQISDVEENENLNIEIDVSEIEMEAEQLASGAKEALEHLENSLAFVKTHDASDFEYIYAEREWRSISPFQFSTEDIALVLVPSSKDDYLDRIMGDDFGALGLPRTTSFVRWEDVVG